MLEEIRRFYRKTKFYFSNQEEFLEDFKTPLNWVKIFFKNYSRFSKIKLQIPERKGELQDLLFKRTSVREFSEEQISFADLEKILYFALGIKEMKRDINQTKRFYPSAGARYPIEAYLIANNVSSLPRGLYHYNIKANELEELITRDLKEESLRIFGTLYGSNPNFIILTGVMSRTEVKYGVNAYRFALLECGHIGQNLYLLAEQKELGCGAIGGFDNDRLTKLLDIGIDEIPLYAFAIGKPKK